jgi:hypothetical protein
MAFAGSILLVAVGAILRPATHFQIKGLDPPNSLTPGVGSICGNAEGG